MGPLVPSMFLKLFVIDLTLKSSNLGKDIIVSLSKGLKFTMQNKHAGLNSTMAKHNYEQSS